MDIITQHVSDALCSGPTLAALRLQ